MSSLHQSLSLRAAEAGCGEDPSRNSVEAREAPRLPVRGVSTGPRACSLRTLALFAVFSFGLPALHSGAVSFADVFEVPSPPFPTIQAALDAASLGDEIVVAAGTYTGDGNRDLQFPPFDVVLRSEEGSASTVLDLEGTPFDPHRALSLDAGQTEATRIEGFTFRNGHAPGMGSNQRGGAVYLEGASPSVVDCLFEDGFAGRGGGLFGTSGASPVVLACRFEGNTATLNGGAMSFQNGCAPRIETCVLAGNVSEKHAGGLGCLDGSPARVEDTVLAGNEAASQGGGVFIDRSNPLFTRCQITGNAADQGGGAYVWRESAPEWTRCTVSANTATSIGGGLYLDNGPTGVVRESIVWGSCAGGNGDEIALRGSVTFLSLVCAVVAEAGIDPEMGSVDAVDLVDADPQFCDPLECTSAPSEAGDFHIEDGSPASAVASPCGILLGAYGVGCGGPTPAQRTSWGRLKSIR